MKDEGQKISLSQLKSLTKCSYCGTSINECEYPYIHTRMGYISLSWKELVKSLTPKREKKRKSSDLKYEYGIRD